MKRCKDRINRSITGLFILIVLFLTGCAEKQDKVTISKLVHVSSFPEIGSRLYLSDIVNFAFFEDQIFISDQSSSSVFMYNLNGEFLGRIGSEGRGPGEFTMQHKIRYNNQKLFVNDQGNRRLITYNLHDSTFEYANLKRLPYEFDANDTLIFSFELLPPGKEYNPKELDLIQVYDHDLNQVNSFGRYLNFVDGMVPKESICLVNIFQDKLYVPFMAYPQVRTYSLDGTLLDTLHLDKRALDYRGRIEDNYRESTFANPYARRLKTLFQAFDQNGSGMFFNIYDEETLIIDQFDYKGNFIRRFTREITAEDYYLKDIKVIANDNGDLVFYILNRIDGFPQVSKYIWKNSG